MIFVNFMENDNKRHLNIFITNGIMLTIYAERQVGVNMY